MSRTPFVAAAAILMIACGGSSPTGTNAVPVASVTVSLAANSVVVGTGTTATAVLKDGSGNILTGRTVSWSSSTPAVATVNSSGAITPLAAGTTSITGTSGSVSGSATLTVVSPAIASVTLTGSTHVKVNDAFPYTATPKLSDGTVVQRTITWSVATPGTATITANGTLTPLAVGTIGIVATIDGIPWTATVTSYDWAPVVGTTSFGTVLPSDTPISNYLGAAEFPVLIVVCANDGTFALGIGFNGIVTESGAVSYSGDTGAMIADTWLEAPPDFDLLIYPGTTNTQHRAFATSLTTNHFLHFTFGEYQHGTHTTQWRLTGMSAAIAPLVAGCPSALSGQAARAAMATLAEPAMRAGRVSASAANAMVMRRE